MNNKISEDELFTIEEPPISYHSSLLNCGVKSIVSNNHIKSYKNASSLFVPVSPKNNFSLCNTIMIPLIINKDDIISDNSYINYNKINYSTSLIKEKDINQNSLKIENTRNKTLSSKNENKEIDESMKEKINIKENSNYEKFPFFLGKNLSANFLNDNNELGNKDLNLQYEKLYECNNNNNQSQNEDSFKYFMNKEESRSVNINEISIKNSILNDKDDYFLKKAKKIKIKEGEIGKKSTKFNKHDLKKLEKKKSFFGRYQSKSFIEEETEKKNNKKTTTNLGEMNYTKRNIIKNKNIYHSNKMVDKNLNENNNKSIIRKKNNKLKENKNDENIGKLEKKKKKKNLNRTPLKEININNKTVKLKLSKPSNLRINKHKIQGLNILKDRINNKDKKLDVSHNSSLDLNRDRLRNTIIKKLKIRKLPSKNKVKNNKDSCSEERKKLKTKIVNRKISGFSFRNKFKRENSDNGHSESKTFQTSRLKNNKEKDNNSKSQYSLKNNITKNILNNSKNEINSLKNPNDKKDNLNKITTVLRKRRSITMNLDKSKIKEVSESMKQKKIESESNAHINININSLSTKNVNKSKKKNKRKFDFLIALKKNSKKMQFNLFSKDKFTNTEFSDSDYIKYTLNCMDLILDIDMEKQNRLKNKINFNFPKPKKKEKKKKIALFDLDETLVHCTGDIKIKQDKYQHAIEIKLPGKQAVKVGINLRPYWKQTINLIKKNYYIVIYTASHQAYADAVLDFIDPKKKYFKYRLYRNNCSLIDVEGAKFYVKDLDIFNEYYDLKDIVIIDNSVLSFAFHLHNGIPIVPYYDEDKDGSLYVVGLYLNHIFDEEDLREANRTQINLDSFLEEAKKQREKENENIIDEESDIEEDEDEDEDEDIYQKKNNEIEEKNGKKDNQTSGKKLMNNKSSNFIMQNTNSNSRSQSHDYTQKKLISQSKLINMYYEVNDESSQNLNSKQIGLREERKTNETLHNNTNALTNKKSDKDKTTYIINDERKFGRKSDQFYFLLEKTNNNDLDNDSNLEEEKPYLKRGLTINENEKNKIKGKLKNIYSNFFNKFKI